jgi:rSAM/selenodomain-associated transferase 2
VPVSIVVPVLDEATIVRGFLEHLRATAAGAQIIIVDGGSKDGTMQICQGLADRTLQTTPGRARQMNVGAQIAQGDILWFLHADSRISANSLAAIERSLSDPRTVGGCFQLQIVPSRWIYRVRDVIGDFCVGLFRIGLGDRGLFCRKQCFSAIGGYPDQPLLEDADFYCKLRGLGRVQLLAIKIQSSARRYEALGPIRTSLFYSFIMILYCAGVPMSLLERLVAWFSVRDGATNVYRLTPEVAQHCR